ncbi:MAG: YkgJ family cysteine cluster protein [Candidatus Poribacteria bacterium]|nr:YkgJ family cysteine cluster protein [Candidatus Poribacteria bacterium]
MNINNIPIAQLYQIIPSQVCFSCDVCCRFLDVDSPLAPIFTHTEKQQVISTGVNPTLFNPQKDDNSSQIKLKPYKDYFICPFFEPETSRCTIYANRPFDCQLYPFTLMFNEDRSNVVLGVDMLCPFSEAHFDSEAFQQHLQHVIEYVESEQIITLIHKNWNLIGEFRDTVKVFHTLEYNVEICNSVP